MTSRLDHLLPLDFSNTDLDIAAHPKPTDPDRFRPDLQRRELTRRDFMQLLGAGLLIAVSAEPAPAQRRRGGGGMGGQRIRNVAARVHIAPDGTITVMTGKVEAGQGSRAEITSAAAEELRIPADRIQLLMADTALVPDDGITAGSGTTPRTIPAVRQGCAAARKLLLQLASERWKVDAGTLQIKDGHINRTNSAETLSYSDLANTDEGHTAFAGALPAEIDLTPLKDWEVLGKPAVRPNARDLVTGRHQYPSDIILPGMLHAKILRAPSYGATLESIDLTDVKKLPDIVVLQDGAFVGFAASTTYAADHAMALAEKSAVWKSAPHPSSKTLFAYLREHARQIPKNPFADAIASSAKSVRQTYNISYIQHAPMEPRAAVAQFENNKLTVWMSTQNPFGCRGEIARATNLPAEQVRVIVPDFGGGFGGKHSGEVGVEAAKLAIASGKPVALRWTRAEEFTWAYFRPAGVIDIEAGLDASGRITCWHQLNINSGGNAVESPYVIAKSRGQFVQSEPPLKQGSYRGLASTANIFARESCMDELALAAGVDPLEFRLKHLEDARLKAVLRSAASKFGWADRIGKKEPNVGFGLSCGTEKGSFTAACVEVAVDPSNGTIAVRHVSQAFECGAILNPSGLMSQVQGGIGMGLGGALSEAIEFENGKITTAAFSKYEVPRLRASPTMDIQLLDRPDLSSAGAGETPIVAIAPAIANAVAHATGQRIRQMPIRFDPKAVAERA
jgi:CO/xanthine dehydrogenase Mo-binding subunit